MTSYFKIVASDGQVLLQLPADEIFSRSDKPSQILNQRFAWELNKAGSENYDTDGNKLPAVWEEEYELLLNTQKTALKIIFQEVHRHKDIPEKIDHPELKTQIPQLIKNLLD